MSAAAEQTTRLGPFTARVVGSEPLGGLTLIRVDLDPRTSLGEPGQFHMLRNATGHDYLARPLA
jgi:hypothetical protein